MAIVTQQLQFQEPQLYDTPTKSSSFYAVLDWENREKQLKTNSQGLIRVELCVSILILILEKGYEARKMYEKQK